MKKVKESMVVNGHGHQNKSVLDELSDSSGTLHYKGNPIEGGGGGTGNVLDKDTTFSVGSLGELQALIDGGSLGKPRAANTRDIIQWTASGVTILDKPYDIPFDGVRFQSVNGGTFQVPADFTGDYAFKFGVNCEFVAELAFPFSRVRYIRDGIGGSDINTANHWIEIEAFDVGGYNHALNKYVYDYNNPSDNSHNTGSTVKDIKRVTDGNKIYNNYYDGTVIGADGREEVVIDLGEPKQISVIKIWHYWNDGRTYYKKRLQVSEDGINWLTVYDDEIDPDYVETSDGKTHVLNGLDIRKQWIISTSIIPVTIETEARYDFMEWDDTEQCIKFNIVPVTQSVDLGGAIITYDTQEEGIRFIFK